MYNILFIAFRVKIAINKEILKICLFGKVFYSMSSPPNPLSGKAIEGENSMALHPLANLLERGPRGEEFVLLC